MKKFLALFICLVVVDCILAAAVIFQKVQEANTRTTLLANQFLDGVATSGASMPATRPSTTDLSAGNAAFAQTATAETKAPIAWSIEIIQNEAQVMEQEGVYPLQKALFTLRVRIPKQVFDELPFTMYLNVLNRDAVYQKVQPGAIQNVLCEENSPGCFAFSGFAEPGYSTGTLSMSLKDGVGTHLLYYRDAQDNRWDKVEFLETEVILERNVFKIASIDEENKVQELPIEQYNGNTLYLVFLLDYRAGPVVTEDEVKKAILRFE